MKLNINKLWPTKKNEYAVLYFRGGYWHIYEMSTYNLRTPKAKEEIIDEVAGEMRVKRKNIKLAKLTSLIVKISK